MTIENSNNWNEKNAYDMLFFVGEGSPKNDMIPIWDIYIHVFIPQNNTGRIVVDF